MRADTTRIAFGAGRPASRGRRGRRPERSAPPLFREGPANCGHFAERLGGWVRSQLVDTEEERRYTDRALAAQAAFAALAAEAARTGD